MRAALLLLAFLGAAAPARACVPAERARVEVAMAEGLIAVPARIDGAAAALALDTGAQRSVLATAAASRLGVALDEWVATTLRGVGGVERRRNAVPRDFAIGGLEPRRATMARDRSFAVSAIDLPAGVDGLLGRDFLAAFDLDLDLRAGTLAFLSTPPCPAGFRPPGAWRALPVSNPADSALVARVELDGTPLRALLDTGATATLLGAPGIARMGLTEAALSADAPAASHGIGPQAVAGWRHRFRSLVIGPFVWTAPTLTVAHVRFAPTSEMLLGADWLAGRRVWISFPARAVFIAEPR